MPPDDQDVKFWRNDKHPSVEGINSAHNDLLWVNRVHKFILYQYCAK
jgi:hypothetical protein